MGDSWSEYSEESQIDLRECLYEILPMVEEDDEEILLQMDEGPVPQTDEGPVPQTDEGPLPQTNGDHQRPKHPRQGNIDLNVGSRKSAPTSEDLSVAFRELYQNFRDGIVESNKLKVTDLRTEYNEVDAGKNFQINIRFFNKLLKTRQYVDHAGQKQSEPKMYGYIQFERSVSESSGSVSLVNFNAKLTEASFRLWESTKQKTRTTNQAGQHGEGLKFAAQRLCAAGYSLAIESDYRVFRFKENVAKNLLYIQFTTPKQSIEKKQQRWLSDGSKRPRAIEAHEWEDVAVRIGSDKTGPRGTVSTKVPEAIFRRWLRVTCDINGPINIISTKSGDLILDPRYRNCIYLMGLKLRRSSASNQGFRYGYNFAKGAIGRDRDAMQSADEETKLLQSIWGEAIERQRQEYTPLTPSGFIAAKTLLDLLNTESPQPADVTNAKQLMSRDTAKEIWKFLLVEAQEVSPPLFYVFEKDEQGARIVRTSLKRQPKELKKELWSILSQNRFGLPLRTPRKEQDHLFQKCPSVPESHLSDFGRCVLSILKSLLLISFKAQEFENFQVIPVDGGQLGISCLYVEEETKLLIHSRKCLDFEEAHTNSGACPQVLEDGRPVFLCDHHVIEVFMEASEEISHALEVDNDTRSASRRISIAKDLLSAMPRAVCCEETRDANQLKVRWESNAPSLEKHRMQHVYYSVELHERTCPEVLRTPIHDDDEATDCHCTDFSQSVRSDKRSILFDDLSQGCSYVATVTKEQGPAIIARSTQAIPRIYDSDDLEEEEEEESNLYAGDSFDYSRIVENHLFPHQFNFSEAKRCDNDKVEGILAKPNSGVRLSAADWSRMKTKSRRME